MPRPKRPKNAKKIDFRDIARVNSKDPRSIAIEAAACEVVAAAYAAIANSRHPLRKLSPRCKLLVKAIDSLEFALLHDFDKRTDR